MNFLQSNRFNIDNRHNIILQLGIDINNTKIITFSY